MDKPTRLGTSCPPGLSSIDPAADDALLARWPHLRRPGPQPCNQIADTLGEALARLQRAPRRPIGPVGVMLRAGRAVRRSIHREVVPIAREVARLGGQLDRLSAKERC